MKPLVMLWRRLPSIFVTLPCSTETARLHASGQSSGQDVSTVLRPQLSSSLIRSVYSPGPAAAGRLRRTHGRQGAAPQAGPRHAGGPPEPPPVPDAAVPGGHRGPVAGRHRLADPVDPAAAVEHARADGRRP